MTDEEIEELLTEEFGHCCNYCYRYDSIFGTCKWDDQETRPDDGERCIGFDWDNTAKKLLREEYAMRTQEGKVDNVWKRWLMAQH